MTAQPQHELPRSPGSESPSDDCRFCRIISGDLPAWIVVDWPGVVGFLDWRPLFKGHVLLVPRSHVPSLLDCPDEALADLGRAARAVSRAQMEALNAEGSFVALNNLVSQSVMHCHLHVVPRRRGDGLKGFFWPRRRYSSAEEAEEVAARLKAALSAEDAKAPMPRS
jgi:histidine triad (HIT) family protein